MNIFKPQPSKLHTLSVDNPHYWALCVSRSQYREDEILSALEQVEVVNTQWQALQEEIYTNVLTDENGEMNSRDGYASEVHKEIHQMVVDTGYVYPGYSQNSHSNCFPVKTWQKDISSLTKIMSKIQKMIDRL